jgi:heme/copper-type cytochrome/quinol oxidase subunit 2
MNTLLIIYLAVAICGMILLITNNEENDYIFSLYVILMILWPLTTLFVFILFIILSLKLPRRKDKNNEKHTR